MTNLALATAALLAVVLVVGLIAVVAHLVRIRTAIADTSATLEAVDAGARALASRMEGLQRATAQAADELPSRRS
ncbi:MAG: hypothetical protein KY461_06100 [Actinobacteria bacterium]|nr:hypothetical protein [Actinomycetota bacterium]